MSFSSDKILEEYRRQNEMDWGNKPKITKHEKDKRAKYLEASIQRGKTNDAGALRKDSGRVEKTGDS
jgi:hypothetical protein